VQWFTLPADAGDTLAAAVDPPGYVAALSALGLRPIGVVLQLLKTHIPMPAILAANGVTDALFYGNLQYYWNTNSANFAPFDAAAMTADVQAQVLAPMGTIQPLFQHNAYLTRLATFISPEEMTSDPLFITNATLPGVAPQHTAVAHVLCGNEDFMACTAPIQLELEDGRTVMYGASSCNVYDRGDLDKLPSANTSWRRDGESEGTLVLDNRAAVADTRCSRGPWCWPACWSAGRAADAPAVSGPSRLTRSGRGGPRRRPR
jgi:hypothetical protein